MSVLLLYNECILRSGKIPRLSLSERLEGCKKHPLIINIFGGQSQDNLNFYMSLGFYTDQQSCKYSLSQWGFCRGQIQRRHGPFHKK